MRTPRQIRLLALLTAAIATLLASCNKTPVPDFSFEPEENPEAGELIQFQNLSENAKSYFWDFGNGQSSTEESPEVRFDPPGNYTVTLEAENGDNLVTLTKDVLINPPTILDLWFYDYDNIPLDYGTVEVYLNTATMNLKYSGSTDDKGHISFQNLEAIEYIVLFAKGNSSGEWIDGGVLSALDPNAISTYIFHIPFRPF